MERLYTGTAKNASPIVTGCAFPVAAEAMRHSLTKDLVAYWRFERPWTGLPYQVRDSVGNSHAQPINGANTVAGGKIGRGVSLDGVDQYLRTPLKNCAVDRLNLHGHDITLAAWFKVNELPSVSNEYKSIYGYGRSLTGGGWYTLYLSKFDTVHFRVDSHYMDGVTTFVVGTWYMILGCFHVSTQRMEVYLNENLEKSKDVATWGTTPTGLSRAFLGTYELSPGNSENFNGVFDELAIWKRTLSAAERSYYYNNGKGRRLLGW